MIVLSPDERQKRIGITRLLLQEFNRPGQGLVFNGFMTMAPDEIDTVVYRALHDCEFFYPVPSEDN